MKSSPHWGVALAGMASRLYSWAARALAALLLLWAAGVIGIEYASIFATFGVKVFVVDKRRRLLEFIDHGIVDELIRQMQAAGVVFHLEESVSSIDTVIFKQLIRGSKTPRT